MAADKAASINNNYSLLSEIISKIDLKPTNVWSIGKMFSELETLAYQKFVIVSSSFDVEDLGATSISADDVKNEIVVSRLLDGLTLK